MFKLIGFDHRISVDAHDDTEVQSVTSHASRAKTGGIKGGRGWRQTKHGLPSPAGRRGRCPARSWSM
ncbi:CreA family protein [Rubrivivax albus]|uniref:CreA family protein n=1 Tax=Rubrivivax albus TaxID=2499835 RepID=UPI004046E691